MKRVLVGLAWFYGIQVLVVFPWHLGAIYRHEQSLWVWTAYARAMERHGQADALLTAYTYLVFYSSLIAIPYVGLGARYRAAGPPAVKAEFRTYRILISAWLAATFLLLSDSCFAFIRNLPTDVWNG